MIVVLIIGVLAAMAYPAFQKVKIYSMASRVASDFRTFASLFETYSLDNGTYPADSSPGALPSGMETYIKIEDWSERTPIGGSYDWVFNGYSGTPVAAISITGYSAGDEPVKKLDEIMDDGGLGSGIVQKSGGSVIYIIE
jgi:type II secretory pathway pseudopilin PulG